MVARVVEPGRSQWPPPLPSCARRRPHVPSIIVLGLTLALLAATPVSADGSALDSAARATSAGELERAQRLLDAHLAAHAPSAPAHELLSTVHRRLGNTAEALAHAERAVALAPQRSSAYLVQSRALRRRVTEAGRLRAMLVVRELDRSTRRALELAPDDAQALIHRGQFLLFAPSMLGGDTNAVREIIARLEPVDPVQAAALEVSRLRRTSDVDAALARCRAALAARPDAQALHLLHGRLLNEQDDPVHAEAAFRAALIGPDVEAQMNASYKLAKILIQRGPPLGEALALLEEYLDGLRRSDLLNTPAAALLWIGRAHEAGGDPQRAREAYTLALRHDAALAPAREALAELDARTGRR